MKKTFFFLAFVAIISYGQAQELQKNRTEVKFNAFSLAIGAIDFEFERTLNKHSSLGMSMRLAFNEGQYSEISTFYRRYLGKKYASGFFVEGFAIYHQKKDLFNRTFHFGTLNVLETRSDFALGLGIGYKWVSKKGLILQTHLGAGPNLINGKNSYGERFAGKAGISIGFGF
ncbi:DUF3575 domain-containing protein [Pseudotenacibaculum sp. MALMAid0570]|uniref:DUF3575 domain-containing protein n=1 Tax=Pseudotenacibaculum sp. MALMAid0570 TaxID=3143938 RepID=UPI0032DF2B20